MTATPDARLQVLSTHYSDVLVRLSSNLKTRLSLVLLSSLVVALMVFWGTDQENANSLFALLIGSQFGGGLTESPRIDPLFLSLLMWFALAVLTAQGCQKSLVIELQSTYLKHLESRMDVFLGKDSVGLMRYRRPKFFAQANGFYLWIFLVSALVVGVGKLVLEVRSTWALFHQPPGSAATVLSPGGTAANDAGDRLTAPPKLRKWTACAFTVFDFSMFLVVVIFGGRFMRDWNDTRRLVFPDST